MQSNPDDQVVGGGSNMGPDQLMEEFVDLGSSKVDNSGAIEDRLASKNWSVRAQAFEELATLFKNADSKHDQIYSEHAPSWKKYLADSNPGSLEKCLDSLTIFIDRADPKVVHQSQNDTIKILIEKCVGHAKPTIRNKALECFNLLFEVTEQFDDSIETMCECLSSKNAKVSQASLVTLNSWLTNYGVKKVKVKSFLTIIENAASSSFPLVRTEAMTFYKECYKWLGEGLKPLIANLKKQQLDDLEKDFTELKDKPKNVRMTRSEKQKAKDSELDSTIKKDAEESKDDAVLDLFDPVDILAKYGGEWQDKVLELKTWKEKKEELEQLINDSNVPKIKPGDFSGMARVLKKLMGDANVVVSQAAVKACGVLAKGLRKDFEPCCKELVPALFQKFKEKKTLIIEEIHQVLENFTLCVNLEFICPEIIAGLQDKGVPTVKRNICTFIEKTAQKTYIDVLQRISSDILQVMVKQSEDPDGDLRNSALAVLGIFKGRLGDSAMSKYLQDMNSQKLDKVNQSAQNVQPSKYDKPEVQQRQAPPPPKQQAAAKGKPAPKNLPIKKQQEVIDEQVTIVNNTNDFDEQPIGGGNKQQNAFDEQPIGGGNKQPNMFDDQPIGGGNKKQNLNDEYPQNDEQPIKKNASSHEDKPIGGKKKIVQEEQPIGGDPDDKPLPKGAYNLDNLGPEAFGGAMPPDEDKPLPKGAYNLDNLGPEAFGGGDSGMMENKPKRKPPAKFANKKVEEEKKELHEDVIMEDVMSPKEEKKVAKPPPRKVEEKKTSSAPAKSSGKPAGGPQIGEDEAATGGMSREEAEVKVNEVFGEDIIGKFEEAKWQDKVEGFKGIEAQLPESNPGADVIEAVIKFVKYKMKDWKESNINLIKETIALLTIISQNCEKINKRAVACAMAFLCDKIGDSKLQAGISEIIMGFSELVTPKFVAMQVIKYASSAKSPLTIKESVNMLIRITDEFGVMSTPLKEQIEFGIVAVNNTNPQVRVQAMALFAIMYKHAGEAIKNFLKDIKESTLKLIEEEFAKTTPFKKGEFVKKRGFRGEAAIQEAPAAGGKKGAAAAGGGGGGLDDLLPRQDISKQITPKLIPMFKHSDWKVRKEAADKIEEMLKGANMRIQPVGLNEIMDNVKQRMKDSNKAVLKAYLQLICQLVEALGASSKQFAKKLLPDMIQNLADKQSLVRGDTIVAMDKWAEHAGPEVVINIGGPLVSQENPELRTEMLKWIIKNKDAIKQSELKDLIKPLVQCLSDKTTAIRNMAEEIITYVMPLTGYQPFQPVISDLLPAVQNAIKQVLEKVKSKVGNVMVAQQDQMAGSLGNKNPPPQQQQQQIQQQQQQQQVPQGPTLKKTVSMKQEIKPKLKEQPPPKEEEKPKINLNQSLGNSNQMMPKLKERTPMANKFSQQRSDSKEATRPKGFNASITSFKQPEEPAQQEFINVVFGHKEKRAEYDRRNKFQLEEVKGEQVEKLKSFIAQCIGSSMVQKMFANDFKINIQFIELMNQLIFQSPEGIREILDLVFKWSAVKLAEGNTQFAVCLYDFYANLFNHLEETEYQLYDFEAQIIIPLLCEKLGGNNSILKEKVKKLAKMIYGIYDKQKCYYLIVQYGLNSKNLKTQAECLDELSDFLVRFGIDYSQDKELKLVAKMADSADKSVRENALKFMGEAFKLLQDNIWRVIGDVTPKVQGLLEQRFKKLKGGLQGSGSTTQLGLQESRQFGVRDSSPSTNKGSQQSNIGGLKSKLQSSTDLGKSINTPRSGLQFEKQKSIQPSGNNNKLSDLSKSIGGGVNKFNSSNRSNGDDSKTPTSGIKKLGMLQKAPSSQDHQQTLMGVKKPLPMTQRQEQSFSDFKEVQRQSEPVQNNLKSSFYQQPPKQQVPHQMFYTTDDPDDEDLRIWTNDEKFGDPTLDKLQDEITKHIHQLKYADLSKRVDSLVSLNDMITAIDQNKAVLVKSANDLVGAFTHVLNDIFDKPVEEIPLRFAKYFITIVLKTCSCKEIMREASEERIFDLAEQLLTRLLIENLDKVGDNKEGELILKNLNSSMLRLLENCNHTYIFCVLFNLLRKYKDYQTMPKLPNLIIKCLLKLSKILEKLIDKLDIEKILLAIHEYLVVINHDSKTQNDEMGIRIVKTVTNELVKLKREGIWEAYSVIQCHSEEDNHIQRWIHIILKSLQTQGVSSLGQSSASTLANSHDSEIRQIVEELRNPEKFETTIPKLYKFLAQTPQIQLDDYLQECSKTFQQFIRTNLEKHKNSLKEENKHNELGMMDSMKSTGSSNNGCGSASQQYQPQENEPKSIIQGSNKIQEYQSKLASIKQRNIQKSGCDTGTNRGTEGHQQHTLNTSFSAMNSSISQKWSEINNRQSNTRREGLQQMSSTMTGFSTGGGIQSNIGRGLQQPQQLNQSSGAVSNGEQNIGGGNGGGATNQDLNKRLAEMKAKLQALKKK